MSWKTPHSSPVRARHAVSFVSANLTEVFCNYCALCTIVQYITATHRESVVFCTIIKRTSLWNILLPLFWNILYKDGDLLPESFIPQSSSFNVTWALTHIGSSPGYIKVVFIAKFTLCLSNLIIIAKSVWAPGGSTVIHKTQYTDGMYIRYVEQRVITVQLIRRSTSIKLEHKF